MTCFGFLGPGDSLVEMGEPGHWTASPRTPPPAPSPPSGPSFSFTQFRPEEPEPEREPVFKKGGTCSRERLVAGGRGDRNKVGPACRVLQQGAPWELSRYL